MTATVRLRLDDHAAPAGEVVGVAEIVDHRMVTVTRELLRCGTATEVRLPAPGRYFARGVLPDGRHVAAPFDLVGGDHVPVAALRDLPGSSGMSPATLAELRSEGVRLAASSVHVSGGGWYPALPPAREPGPSWLQIRGPSVTAPFRPYALQVASRAASTITIVPPGAPIGISMPGPGSGAWSAALLPGLGTTLLGYLDRGDSAAAQVIADFALAANPAPTGELADLAVGYYLLRGHDPRFAAWVERLNELMPGWPDVAVLEAWRLMREPDDEGPAVRAALLRAAGSGLPVVSDGLRLLVEGLSTFDDDDARVQHRRLRRYLFESLPSAVTSFAGYGPDVPGRATAPARPAAARPIPDLRPAPFDPYLETVERWYPLVHDYLLIRTGDQPLAHRLTGITFRQARGARTRENDLAPGLIAIARHHTPGRFRIARPARHLDAGAATSALAELRPLHGELTVLRWWLGLTLEQAAAAMSLSRRAAVIAEYGALCELADRLPELSPARAAHFRWVAPALAFLTGALAAAALVLRLPVTAVLMGAAVTLIAAALARRAVFVQKAERSALAPSEALTRRLIAERPVIVRPAQPRLQLRLMLRDDAHTTRASPLESTAIDKYFKHPNAARTVTDIGRRRIRRRGAIVLGIAVGALAVSGISAASENASPGDALYGVKRSTERAQLAMAGSDFTRGQLSLDFARTRLTEALSATDPEEIDKVLDDMDNDTVEGIRLLFTSAVTHNRPSALGTVDSFVTGQRIQVARLRRSAPAAARPRIEASAALLDQVGQRSHRLRDALSCDPTKIGPADHLGPRAPAKTC